MKRIPFIMIILVLGLAISCGNDPTGDGQVGLTLRTEDGIENFESILAPGSSKSIPTSIAPYVEYFEVQAFANGQVSFRNLLMMNVVSKDKLLEGDLLVMDVPSGKDMIFRVSTLDSKGVVTYSGDSAPLNIEPNTSVPIDITLKKVTNEPVLDKSLKLILRDFTSKLTNQEVTYASIFESKFSSAIANHYVRVYTQTIKDGEKWILTNPGAIDIDPMNGVGYSGGSSEWQGTKFISNMFQIISVRAEDSAQGVIAYGTTIYHPLSGITDLPVYMRFAAKLSVTFTGSISPTSDHTLKMNISGQWYELPVAGTNQPSFNPGAVNPVVFDAPSAEKWFPVSPEPVGTRSIQAYKEGSPISVPVSVEVDFGISDVTVNLLNPL